MSGDGRTLPGALRETAARYPDREALLFGERRVTYAELVAGVERVAAGLYALGVRTGDRVAVWLPNYPEWVYSALALAGLGAAIVPVNTRYREHEAERVLAGSEVSTLITTDQFMSNRYLDLLSAMVPELLADRPGEVQARRLPALRRVVMVSERPHPGTIGWGQVLERGRDARLQAVVRELATRVAATDPLYIFWTSGTTAAPKGVVHDHTLLSNVDGYCEVLGITAADRCVVSMPLFYIAGTMWCFLTPILAGAAMVLATQLTPDEILALIETHRATVLIGVPSMFVSYLEHPRLDRFDRRSLRTGWVGGAPPSPKLVQDIRARLGVRELVQIYGMTETHGITTMTRRTDSDEVTSSRIGLPLPTFRLKVADPQTGQPVPDDTPGELCVGPPRLPVAVLGISDADRRGMFDAEGWLRTGDVVVRHGDGYYSLVGRIKDMAKVGGENVASAEVEHVLAQHPAVVQAAAFGIPDERKGEVVAAYVQASAGVPVTEDELRAWVRTRMAPFKVPAVIRVIESAGEWPLTASGKIKKFELRERLLAELAADPGPRPRPA